VQVVVGSVCAVAGAETPGNEDFDLLTQQFFPLIPKQSLGLGIHQENPAAPIGNDDGVRSLVRFRGLRNGFTPVGYPVHGVPLRDAWHFRRRQM